MTYEVYPYQARRRSAAAAVLASFLALSAAAASAAAALVAPLLAAFPAEYATALEGGQSSGKGCGAEIQTSSM